MSIDTKGLKKLVKANVPVAPIYKISEVTEDPQVKHRGMIISMEHPDAGVVKSVNFPVKFSKTSVEIKNPAPLLGQHNEEILEELLGYKQEKIMSLRKDGVIT